MPTACTSDAWFVEISLIDGIRWYDAFPIVVKPSGVSVYTWELAQGKITETLFLFITLQTFGGLHNKLYLCTQICERHKTS